MSQYSFLTSPKIRTPNPGPGDTRLEFLLAEPGRLGVTIYAVTGQMIADLGVRDCDAGSHAVLWDKSVTGSPVPSGVYLVRGILESVDGIVGEARGRVVVLR